jgi:hypothetical protein
MSKNSKESLENTLVWSSHRVRLLGQCERRYYHQYIGSWGGWEDTASPESQAAYHSKYLTTPAIEIGQIVHARIRAILEMAMAGYSIDGDLQCQIARGQFESFANQSRHRSIKVVSQKRRKFLLHELGAEISPQKMAAHLDQITLLLRGFFAFAEVQSNLADPRGLIPELLDPVGFSVGHELGVPSRPRTDAAYLTPDGQEIVIADWKCGSAHDEEHRQQALTYDIFVRRRLNLVPAESTRISMFYLASAEVCSFRFSEDERQERLWQIGEEFESLRQRSDNPQINVGPESRFRPQVSRACFFCNFRLMCDPFLASPLVNQEEAL